MNRLNLVGAIAANLCAQCFIVGFGLYFGLLAHIGYPSFTGNISKQIAFMEQHHTLLNTWYLIIYVLFGVCLGIVIPFINTYYLRKQKLFGSIASGIGWIWAGLLIACGLIITIALPIVSAIKPHNPEQAETLWLVIHTLAEGIGGGNELIGGVWLTLTNGLLLTNKICNKTLAKFGVIIGVCGCLTIIPNLAPLAAIFGIGCIIWFGILSVVLINQKVVKYQ